MYLASHLIDSTVGKGGKQYTRIGAKELLAQDAHHHVRGLSRPWGTEYEEKFLRLHHAPHQLLQLAILPEGALRFVYPRRTLL